MKMLPKKVVEVGEEGLVALLGETVTLFCANYIYTGKLERVNETCIKLSSPKIVYETGDFSEKGWKDSQALPNDWYIQLDLIESFGILK
jgi:hypothetical protein